MMILQTVWIAPAQDSLLARQKNRNMTLELQGGYSIALGRYAAADRENKSSGFAANGFFIRAAGNWLGRSGLGLGISYTYQNNPLQRDHKADTLVDQYSQLGNRHWSNHYLLAGPVFSREFKRFRISVKVQAGGILAFSPLFRIWMPSTDSLNPGTMTLTDGPGFGVAVLAAAETGYKLTEKLSLNLSFAYLGGNPARKKSYSQVLKDEDTGQYYFVQGERECSKKISTFNIGIGLIYQL